LRDIENSGLPDKFIEFIKNLREDVIKLNTKFFIDIHSGNIGINKNGDYILFDY